MIGQTIELSIWLSGDESEGQIEDWKSTVCGEAARTFERTHGVALSDWFFAIKRPGEERVPAVPGHISGIDVRLLVATAMVVKKKLFAEAKGFVYDLREEDLQKLRNITRRAYEERWPGVTLTDRQCDQIIEAAGPEAAVKTLRRDR